MARYVLAATALKVMSLNRATRWGYRKLGNAVGGRRRKSRMNAHYVLRAERNLRRIEAAGAIRDGQTILELGTGWIHWESLYTRLFYDVAIIAYDVWDNRHFDAFQSCALQLAKRIETEVDRPAHQIERARSILTSLRAAQSFEDAYKILNITYLLSPDGRLDGIESGSVDLIISSDVLEHIPSSSITTLIADMERVLKAGGHSAHWVVPADHLRIYAPTVNGKQYMVYGEQTWKRFFENEVQYFNRVQMSDWKGHFESGGFEIRHLQVEQRGDVGSLKLAPRFSRYGQDDLECEVFSLVARKPDLSA